MFKCDKLLCAMQQSMPVAHLKHVGIGGQLGKDPHEIPTSDSVII